MLSMTDVNVMLYISLDIYHQMKPCQVDWQKLVFQEKIVLFQRKKEFLIEKDCYIQQEGKFLTYTNNCEQKATIVTVKSMLKIPP